MAEFATVEKSVAAIRQRHDGQIPKTAIVLGSGLGSFAEQINAATTIPYEEISGFPASTVAGHAGRLLIGEIEGSPIYCMQGRMHLYEGYSAQQLALPIRTMKMLGVERLILTNAAGGLRAEHPAGSLMVITDHINFSGHNPMTGPNDERFGDRFFDMSNAYDESLRADMLSAAEQEGIDVFSGVYLQVLGPSFETPAEVRMFARLGADAVGMSTVPECLTAVHCGLKVVGLSLISNMAAGVSAAPVSYEEVFDEAKKAETRITRLLIAFLKMVSNADHT